MWKQTSEHDWSYNDGDFLICDNYPNHEGKYTVLICLSSWYEPIGEFDSLEEAKYLVEHFGGFELK